MRASADFATLQGHLGVTIPFTPYLERALTHGSVNQIAGTARESNRSLAFLGDAVIELAIRHRDFTEGKGAKVGALSIQADEAVRNRKLAERARAISLGDYIELGKGAERERNEDSVLATALEAVLGAVSIEKGFKEATDCALRLLPRAANPPAVLGTRPT